MNLEQDRSFVCNAPGCSQHFQSEDHLMIHRHKHEMTLKFASIKNDNMLSDQTPTPTRFLKNCEEVGLFNDIDCSLEHEFRNAQEDENSKRSINMHNAAGGMTGPGTHQLSNSRLPNHDTSVVIQQAMPSPQSSSVITQAPSTNRQIGPVPGSLSSLLHLHNRQRQPMPASMPGTLPNPTMPGSSAVLMPRLKAALSHHPGAISNGNMNSMGHMIDMMNSRQEQSPHHHMHSHPHQHQSLPQHHPYPHQQHQHPPHHPHSQPHHQQGHPHHHSHSHLHAHPSHHQTSPHPPLHTGGQAQLSPAAQQMQPSQTIQPQQPTGGRRRRVVDEDPDERRRKFLERNRAAATRCRQKRKVWVMSLEKKAEELTQTNMQLQNEVSMLKNEVAQLKQLLLTHKDCPITAMQKESQGYLSPENSPPESPVPACSQQQVIQHNTITTSSSVGDLVGSSNLNPLANHRTDINPIL
ncbi:cyclic AMP-responsive element-binding protein 5 isoform X2 [Xenopus laevis]|uniref:Cyclic AMP-responsive element-binding protein 5 isoform X2 n=1 Tax=Xenopus laevis TaxID=8355 RepID=A0A8J1KX91_XENLA|nr:cyclic AMP-responsive element-binding protein 5 isoform X2 [Xenopus laevis]